MTDQELVKETVKRYKVAIEFEEEAGLIIVNGNATWVRRAVKALQKLNPEFVIAKEISQSDCIYLEW